MIKTIVVATDGSKHADKAITAAGEIAGKFGARVVVVHTALTGATSATLRKLATRKALTKDQRDLLDNYEADVLMAMSGAGMAPMTVVPPPAELLHPIGDQLLQRAAAAAKKAGAKRVSTVYFGGDPADAILKTAKKEKADLIALGTRGLGEIKGLFLGSVSHKVSAHADCAVLTVK
jgi:nucleotide-binding universal stress UspA family protein